MLVYVATKHSCFEGSPLRLIEFASRITPLPFSPRFSFHPSPLFTPLPFSPRSPFTPPSPLFPRSFYPLSSLFPRSSFPSFPSFPSPFPPPAPFILRSLFIVSLTTHKLLYIYTHHLEENEKHQNVILSLRVHSRLPSPVISGFSTRFLQFRLRFRILSYPTEENGD